MCHVYVLQSICDDTCFVLPSHFPMPHPDVGCSMHSRLHMLCCTSIPVCDLLLLVVRTTAFTYP